MPNEILRISYHLAFWGLFTLLFAYQNPEANAQDYASWFIILGVMAVVVYTNQYLLLPRFFFKKDLVRYALWLLALVFSGAILLKMLIISSRETLKSSITQNAINLLLFVVITSSVKFLREYLRKQEQLIKVENQQLKTEIALLKSQVNPHFLFNTLNNLYGLILHHKNEEAAEITLKLSDLMRYLLESSKTEKVSLKREIQFVRDYLALEKIRLSQRADIRFDVLGLEEDKFIAPLLFVPLVENAFKHGLQTLSESSFAHFSLAIQGDDVLFEAHNSVGKTPNSQPKSETGLENLRKRLELIYPQRHLFEVDQTAQLFKVSLHINL